jgi:hypothetical protein
MAEAKVLLPRRLHQEPTASLKWIAQRLRIGCWTGVFNLLERKSQTMRLCK